MDSLFEGQSSSRFIDISVPLREGLPIWPGSIGLRVNRTMRLERGDPANVTRLDFDVHVGTHVESSLHFIAGGQSVDSIPLDVLIGPVQVVYLPNSKVIGGAELEALKLPADTRRLVLRTRNSELWRNESQGFLEDYVGLTCDAAQWIVARGIRLVGIDYLSVATFGACAETHRILMSADVIILEGLDLTGISPGIYELICLPIRLAGAEGAPARAVLRSLPSSTPV